MFSRIFRTVAIVSCIILLLALANAAPVFLSWQTVTIENGGTKPLVLKIYDHVWTIASGDIDVVHFKGTKGDAGFSIERGELIENHGYVTSGSPSCYKITAQDGDPTDFQRVAGEMCHFTW